MSRLIYFFIFGAVLNSGILSKKHGHVKSSGGKIVGGYNTTINNVPHQVYLLLRQGQSNYQCGGSIISNRVILTAAHCLVGIQSASIRVGSTFADKGGTVYQSSWLVTHPQYNSQTSDYDVGVIKSLRKIKLDGTTSKIIPIAQEGSSIPDGSSVTVSGWGTTTENGDTSDSLLAVDVPVISDDSCNQTMNGMITARMFCAGLEEGGKDSCQGDSGGPAVTDGTQVGIVSFGVGCARAGYPGVYTRVSAVRSWINKMTRI